nr:peroxisomal sarcosine oxidase-like isoform X2 [Cherax quadricarinatus]
MAEVLETDVVVVGAGIIGSWTALHVARAGRKIILLDQFPLPHSRGSSHGQSRINRLANFGDAALTGIMRDAFTQWESLQQDSGSNLFRPASLLALGLGKQRQLLEKIAASVEVGGHTPVWLTSQCLKDKYGINVVDDGMAVLDPSGGVLMADKCLAAVQQVFSQTHGIIVDSWPVDDILVATEGQAEVKGPRGTVRANVVVLCPGPWAGPLLAKLDVHIPLKVEKISVLYWRIQNPGFTTTTFIDFHDPRGHFYGLPELEYPGLVKVVFHGGPEVKPDERDEGGRDEEMRKMVSDYVRKTFPFLHPHPVIQETCLYTCSPDQEMVVDQYITCCCYSAHQTRRWWWIST